MKKNRIRLKTLFISIIILVLVFVSSGIYSLKSGQHALIIRFGKISDEVISSGIHFHLPYPVERVVKVFMSEVKKVFIVDSLENIEQYEDPKENSVEMLTGDENLIMINAVVNYDIKELEKYLYNTKDPKKIIESVGKKCLGYRLGKMKVDDVLSGGKSRLRLMLKEDMQEILNKLEVGVRIISIEFIDVSPPPSVSPAFKAVSDTREKKQEIIKSAEGYANSIIPKARGEASSILTKAQAYSEEVVAKAKGFAKAYLSVLKEYKKSPKMTMKLRYLETIKSIFERAKISIDPNPSKSVYYIKSK
jgi:membrane protease subunit HflK